jgi:hypothetical protein
MFLLLLLLPMTVVLIAARCLLSKQEKVQRCVQRECEEQGPAKRSKVKVTVGSKHLALSLVFMFMLLVSDGIVHIYGVHVDVVVVIHN